jgi:hypothetical protein
MYMICLFFGCPEAGLRLIDLLEQAKLPDVNTLAESQRLPTLREKFADLHDPNFERTSAICSAIFSQRATVRSVTLRCRAITPAETKLRFAISCSTASANRRAVRSTMDSVTATFAGTYPRLTPPGPDNSGVARPASFG